MTPAPRSPLKIVPPRSTAPFVAELYHAGDCLSPRQYYAPAISVKIYTSKPLPSQRRLTVKFWRKLRSPRHPAGLLLLPRGPRLVRS